MRGRVSSGDRLCDFPLRSVVKLRFVQGTANAPPFQRRALARPSVSPELNLPPGDPLLPRPFSHSLSPPFSPLPFPVRRARLSTS